jgi:hypothetical protein
MDRLLPWVATLAAGVGLLLARSLLRTRDRTSAPSPSEVHRLVEEFLAVSPGPLELRPLDGGRPLRLQGPAPGQVLALGGSEGAELWRLEGPGSIAFIAIPPSHPISPPSPRSEHAKPWDLFRPRRGQRG